MARPAEIKSPVQVFSRPRAPARTRTADPQPVDLAQVFDEYGGPVYSFLYGRVGNREDAEDLTSEVFLRASRQLDTGRARASIVAWLFTVARTILADHWRRHYRDGKCLSLDDTRVEELPSGLQRQETSDGAARRVAEVLQRLPERYRQVLELRFLSGYSIRETAQEMGISPENVKVIQHRALARAVQVEDELS